MRETMTGGVIDVFESASFQRLIVESRGNFGIDLTVSASSYNGRH